MRWTKGRRERCVRASFGFGFVTVGVGQQRQVSRILFWLSAVVAVATWNAPWPLCRPWWLKLPSFNAGWLVNEMPFHVLAGHAFVVAFLARLGALDDHPRASRRSLERGVGRGPHRSCGSASPRRQRHRRGAASNHRARWSHHHGRGSYSDRSVPRSWLVSPWWAWFPAPGSNASPTWSTPQSLDEISSSICTCRQYVHTIARSRPSSRWRMVRR